MPFGLAAVRGDPIGDAGAIENREKLMLTRYERRRSVDAKHTGAPSRATERKTRLLQRNATLGGNHDQENDERFCRANVDLRRPSRACSRQGEAARKRTF